MKNGLKIVGKNKSTSVAYPVQISIVIADCFFAV